MARAIWSGVISFGPVSAPVELYSAIKPHEPTFHQFLKGTADSVPPRAGSRPGAGKMGAFAGAFLFPDMLASSLGIRGAEIVAGVVAAAGQLLTIAVLPEPKGKILDSYRPTPTLPSP